MKCCDVKAGDLRTLISIERRTATPDGVGGFTEAWAADPTGGVWAKVRAVGGSERWMADRITPGNRYKFVVRFKGDGNGAPYWTVNDRISWRGRTLGIESVVDMEDRQKFVEISALENKAT